MKRNIVIALALLAALALASSQAAVLPPAQSPQATRALFGAVPTHGTMLTSSSLRYTDNPEETLNYDGDNASAVGLTNGGTFRGAVRFTTTQTCTLKSVLFYQNDASDNDYVFIYAENIDTIPGAVLESVPYDGSASLTWKRVDLTTPIVFRAGTDFWPCVRVTAGAGLFPLGTDAGPMLRDRGGFISTGTGWDQLADVGLDYNWNIRAVIEPGLTLAHDVGVTKILTPATSVRPGAVTPSCRLTNFGSTSETNIPVTCWIDSAGTRVYDHSDTLAGPLAAGARSDVAFATNWTPGAPPNEYDVTFFTDLATDLDRSNDTATQVTNVTAFALVLDHDTGNCRLSVSAQGSIGWDDPAQTLGVGFHYPRTAPNTLFYSSLALGTDSMYVADRWYGQPSGTAPVNSDLLPVESLTPVFPPSMADEQFHAIYDDAGHTTPKGITVTQNSFASANPNYDDYAIIVFDIANNGAAEVDSLYAGVFADFDIGTANPADNVCVSDTVRGLVYMKQNTVANPTVGIQLLEPTTYANLCAVDNEVYVYPDSCTRDAQKIRFLNGTIATRNSNRPYDWSILVSVGPFDIPVGETQRFAVAFVGGTTIALCQANADSARSRYAGISEQPGVSHARRITVEPNPFRGGTFVRYSTTVEGPLHVTAFDASGRLVYDQTRMVKAGAGSMYWQPEGVARGVYFLNVRTPDGTTTSTALRLD